MTKTRAGFATVLVCSELKLILFEKGNNTMSYRWLFWNILFVSITKSFFCSHFCQAIAVALELIVNYEIIIFDILYKSMRTILHPWTCLQMQRSV